MRVTLWRHDDHNGWISIATGKANTTINTSALTSSANLKLIRSAVLRARYRDVGLRHRAEVEEFVCEIEG